MRLNAEQEQRKKYLISFLFPGYHVWHRFSKNEKDQLILAWISNVAFVYFSYQKDTSILEKLIQSVLDFELTSPLKAISYMFLYILAGFFENRFRNRIREEFFGISKICSKISLETIQRLLNGSRGNLARLFHTQATASGIGSASLGVFAKNTPLHSVNYAPSHFWQKHLKRQSLSHSRYAWV